MTVRMNAVGDICCFAVTVKRAKVVGFRVCCSGAEVRRKRAEVRRRREVRATVRRRRGGCEGTFEFGWFGVDEERRI